MCQKYKYLPKKYHVWRNILSRFLYFLKDWFNQVASHPRRLMQIAVCFTLQLSIDLKAVL